MTENELDIEKLGKCEGIMMLKIVRLIATQEKGKEMTAASVVALSNVMVMMLTKMVGQEKVVDYVSLIVSRSLRITNDLKQWQDEQNINTETP